MSQHPAAKKVCYEQMFPHEFAAALKRNSVAYLPLGSLEYHGYHNALGLDSLKAWKICQLAAQEHGGIVFPPLSLGVDTWPDIDLVKFPNKQFDCYHVPAETYQKLLEHYFARMHRIGFQKLFVLAGHYPNAVVAERAATNSRSSGVEIFVVKEPDLIPGQTGDHAGKWETSLLMALYPELVDLRLMEGKEDRLRAVNGEDPAESSAEHGHELVEQMVAAIGKLLA